MSLISEKLRELREAEAGATKGPWIGWFVTTSPQELPDGRIEPLIHGAAPPHELSAENPEAVRKAGCDGELIYKMRNHFSAMLDVIEAAHNLRHRNLFDGTWCEANDWERMQDALKRLAGVR